MGGLIAASALALTISRPSADAPTPESSSPSPGGVAHGFALSVASVDGPGVVYRLGGTPPTIVAETDVDPVIAATSDGSQVFVLSGLDEGSALSAIDAASGTTLTTVAVPGRWRGTLPAYFDVLTVSADDRWVFILGFFSAGAERDGYFFHVYDVARGALLPDVVPLPGCAGGLLLPGPADLEIMCPHSGTILSTSIDADGSPDIITSVDVSLAGLAGASRLPGGQGTIVLTREGNIVRVGQAGVERLFSVDEGIAPVFDSVEVSPSGELIAVARGTTSGSGIISEVELYSLDGERVASHRLEQPAWSMTVDRTGSRLLLPVMTAEEVVVLNFDDLSPQEPILVPGTPVWVVGG